MSLDLIPDKKAPLLNLLDQRFLDKYGLRAEPDKSGVGWWLTADDKNSVALDGRQNSLPSAIRPAHESEPSAGKFKP